MSALDELEAWTPPAKTEKVSVLDELEAWTPPAKTAKVSVLDELEAWEPPKDTIGKKASRFAVGTLGTFVETGSEIKKLAAKVLPYEKQLVSQEKTEKEMEMFRKRGKELEQKIGKPDILSGAGKLTARP